MKALRGVKVLALAACVAGCATAPTPDVNAFAKRSGQNSFELFHRSMAPASLVLPVRQDRQTTRASCGAHALASVLRYWRGAGAASGDAVFKANPPADRVAGYSLSELLDLAHRQGLLASAVRLDSNGLIGELEKGRPVLIPVRVPGVYIDAQTLPGAGKPVVGLLPDLAVNRAAQLSEMTQRGLASHYLVVAGYGKDRFMVVDPVRGLRTISFARLDRYRNAFGDAAIVFSLPPEQPRRVKPRERRKGPARGA